MGKRKSFAACAERHFATPAWRVRKRRLPTTIAPISAHFRRNLSAALTLAALAFLVPAAPAFAATVWNLEMHHNQTNFSATLPGSIAATTANQGSATADEVQQITLTAQLGKVYDTVPPQLQRMTVKVNRHGLLQSKGLPYCALPQIQPASDERALQQCSDALVGSGRFWASVVFPDQRPYPTRGRLLIFNGETVPSAAQLGVLGRLPAGHVRGTLPLSPSLRS